MFLLYNVNSWKLVHNFFRHDWNETVTKEEKSVPAQTLVTLSELSHGRTVFRRKLLTVL